MLAGSYHLVCKVTLTSRREARATSSLYILLNATQRCHFVISLTSKGVFYSAMCQYRGTPRENFHFIVYNNHGIPRKREPVADDDE